MKTGNLFSQAKFVILSFVILTCSANTVYGQKKVGVLAVAIGTVKIINEEGTHKGKKGD